MIHIQETGKRPLAAWLCIPDGSHRLQLLLVEVRQADLVGNELFHHVALHLLLPRGGAAERCHCRLAQPSTAAPRVLELLEAKGRKVCERDAALHQRTALCEQGV